MGDYLVDFIHLFRIARLVLFVFLVEVSSLNLHREARFNLSVVEHLQGNPDALLLRVRKSGVSLRYSLFVLIDLDLFFSSLVVDANNSRPARKLFDLLFSDVRRQSADVYKRVYLRVVPLLLLFLSCLC